MHLRFNFVLGSQLAVLGGSIATPGSVLSSCSWGSGQRTTQCQDQTWASSMQSMYETCQEHVLLLVYSLFCFILGPL